MIKEEVLDKNKYKLFSDGFSKTKIVFKSEGKEKVYIISDKNGRSNK